MESKNSKNITKAVVLIFLACAFFIFLWRVRSDYEQLFRINREILLSALPLIILLIVLLVFSVKIREHIVTFTGIIFAFFIFLFGNLYVHNRIMDAVSANLDFNCKISNGIIISTGAPNFNDQFHLSRYETDLLIQNMNVIYREWGKEKSDKILFAISKMKSANLLFDQIGALNIQGVNPALAPFITVSMSQYKAQRVELSKEVASIVCAG